MKYIIILIAQGMLFSITSQAQLFINSNVTIQNNVTLYADDTIHLGASAAVSTNGIFQSTKSINTNGSFINTGTTGFIISPVAPGVSKSFDIGTTSNNKIQIQHLSASTTPFQMAVRDNIFLNPQTNATQITNNVVNKTWYLSPLSPVSTLSGTAYWNASDESTGFLRGNCGMSFWQSGTSTAWTFVGGTVAATITGSSPAYSKTAVTTGFSSGVYYIGVGGSGSSLPVTFLMFDVTKNDQDDVVLKWITSNEFNSKEFELERSFDGSQLTINKWETITKVKAAGNSNTERKYSYTDLLPFAKLHTSKLFYRLKQIDLDGKYQYSETRELNLQKTDIDNLQITMYPNPSDELLNIDFESTESQNVSILLFDAGGKNIAMEKYDIENGKQTFQINTSLLAPGVYLLQIIDDNNANVSKQKLIIY